MYRMELDHQMLLRAQRYKNARSSLLMTDRDENLLLLEKRSLNPEFELMKDAWQRPSSNQNHVIVLL